MQLNNKRKAAAAANIDIHHADYEAVPVPENVDDMVSHLMNGA